VCQENCGEGCYMYLYTWTSRISKKKGKILLFGRIRHLVCLGNERRDSSPCLCLVITTKLQSEYECVYLLTLIVIKWFSKRLCDLDLWDRDVIFEGGTSSLCGIHFYLVWCMTKLQPGHDCVYLLILIVIMWNFKMLVWPWPLR
jgi:hypothetical protein